MVKQSHTNRVTERAFREVSRDSRGSWALQMHPYGLVATEQGEISKGAPDVSTRLHFQQVPASWYAQVQNCHDFYKSK